MTIDEMRMSTAAVVTITAVAGLLQVDERTVRRGCASGQIPSITVGRRVLVVREKLLAMLTAQDAPKESLDHAGRSLQFAGFTPGGDR